jgi:hypothetical protein
MYEIHSKPNSYSSHYYLCKSTSTSSYLLLLISVHITRTLQELVHIAYNPLCMSISCVNKCPVQMLSTRM